MSEFKETLEKIFRGEDNVQELIPYISDMIDTSYTLSQEAAARLIECDFKSTKEGYGVRNLNDVYKASTSNFMKFMENFLLKSKEIAEEDINKKEIEDCRSKAIEMQKAKAEFNSDMGIEEVIVEEVKE